MAQGAFPSQAKTSKPEKSEIKIDKENWSDLKMLIPKNGKLHPVQPRD